MHLTGYSGLAGFARSIGVWHNIPFFTIFSDRRREAKRKSLSRLTEKLPKRKGLRKAISQCVGRATSRQFLPAGEHMRKLVSSFPSLSSA
jgi:hypothetical protein